MYNLREQHWCLGILQTFVGLEDGGWAGVSHKSDILDRDLCRESPLQHEEGKCWLLPHAALLLSQSCQIRLSEKSQEVFEQTI